MANRSWRHGYIMGLLAVLLCTLVAWGMSYAFALANLIMVYLLGVVAVAVRYGRGPSVLTCVLGVAAFDFFFVPPYFTFEVADTQYVVTFSVMLMVGLVISSLAAGMRVQARAAAHQERRAETERFRNALLAAISHDLRTPLAAIVGASSSLQEGDKLSVEARRELSRNILDSALSMSELVNKVLEMVRLQSGSIQLQLEWLPLEEVVGSVLHRLKTQLTRHMVTVELPENLPWLSFDAGLIEEVLVNLLENAVKYTPAGTAIRIGATMQESSVVVEVTDAGPGLLPGSEREVFEKFYRAQAESAQGGVGLGLAICLAIVEAHRGRIWAENRPGGGASFKFSLPATGTPPTIEPETDA